MDLLKMPGVVYCEFKKNAYIIRQGEKVDSIYYLVSGTCYRTTVTEKGDEEQLENYAKAEKMMDY